jgi:uncharacterized membrane protein YhaH (DUF805 family)
VILLTSVVRLRLDDFTGSGQLLDALCDRNLVAYWCLLGQPNISLNVVVIAAVLALHALGLWAFLAITARRLQDMGRPGVYAAAVLLVGPAGMLLLAILPGDKAENVYGPASRRFQSRAGSGGDAVATGPNTR